jgi:hypothetical protein
VLFTRDPSHDRNKHLLRVKDWKKIYQAKGTPIQAGEAILISDKVDFKLTLIKRDKKRTLHTNKRENTEKEITTINLYAPNVSAPIFMKLTQNDLKAHIDSNTVVMGGITNR